jgi:hypothetical protein
MKLTPKKMLASAGIAALALGGGVASAAIPSGDGTLTACAAKTNRTSGTGLLGPQVTLDRQGTLRAIDTETGQHCRPDEQPLSWNIKGQPGDPGPTGPAGPQGPPGPAGPTTPPTMRMAEAGGGAVPSDGQLHTVVSIGLPAGAWALVAKGTITASTSDPNLTLSATCGLQKDGVWFDSADLQLGGGSMVGGRFASIPFSLVGVSPAGTVTLGCITAPSASLQLGVGNVKILATAGSFG